LPTLRFKGEVSPGLHRITLSEPVKCTWEAPDGAHVCQFQILINDSRIEVICEASHLDNEYNENYVYWRAQSSAQTVVDLMMFLSGLPLHARLDTYINENGESLIVTYPPHIAASSCQSFSWQSLGQIWPVISSDMHLFMALNDLNHAISYPGLIGVNCGRIVEAIRKSNSSDSIDTSEQWAMLRSSLNLSRDYLQFIMDNSLEPRHGTRFGLDGRTLDELLQRTWKIIDRYIELKKRGTKSLPLGEFPIL
jgi:hypothetical protein